MSVLGLIIHVYCRHWVGEKQIYHIYILEHHPSGIEMCNCLLNTTSGKLHSLCLALYNSPLNKGTEGAPWPAPLPSHSTSIFLCCKLQEPSNGFFCILKYPAGLPDGFSLLWTPLLTCSIFTEPLALSTSFNCLKLSLYSRLGFYEQCHSRSVP